MTEINESFKDEFNEIINKLTNMYILPKYRETYSIEDKFNESIMNAISSLVIAKACLKEIEENDT